MIVPPGSIASASCAIVESVISPAGTITQAARGGSSAATKSATVLAPTAPSAASAATASELTS